MARADGVSPPPSETSAPSPCRSAKPMLSTCSIVFTASKSAESTAEKMSRKTITCSHYRGPTSSGNEINTKLSNWEACKVFFFFVTRVPILQKIGRMLKHLVPKFPPDLSVCLKDIAEKQVTMNLKPDSRRPRGCSDS